MPFEPDERPPKYKREEYPPIWAYPENYEKFCKENGYQFYEEDMWKTNKPWFIFWALLKNNKTDIEELANKTTAACKKIHNKHKITEGVFV